MVLMIALSIKDLYVTLSISDIHHNNQNRVLFMVMLNVVMLSDVMLTVIMLSVAMLNVVIMSVVMLSVLVTF